MADTAQQLVETWWPKRRNLVKEAEQVGENGAKMDFLRWGGTFEAIASGKPARSVWTDIRRKGSQWDLDDIIDKMHHDSTLLQAFLDDVADVLDIAVGDSWIPSYQSGRLRNRFPWVGDVVSLVDDVLDGFERGWLRAITKYVIRTIEEKWTRSERRLEEEARRVGRLAAQAFWADRRRDLERGILDPKRLLQQAKRRGSGLSESQIYKFFRKKSPTIAKFLNESGGAAMDSKVLEQIEDNLLEAFDQGWYEQMEYHLRGTSL